MHLLLRSYARCPPWSVPWPSPPLSGIASGRFVDLDHRVAAALALPDLGAAVKRVVRLLLEHSGDGLTDDVALVLASSRDNVT